MTPIWSATSNRPEPSSSGINVVGEVNPSANTFRPTPGGLSAAVAAAPIGSKRRQKTKDRAGSRETRMVFTRRTLAGFSAITRALRPGLRRGCGSVRENQDGGSEAFNSLTEDAVKSLPHRHYATVEKVKDMACREIRLDRNPVGKVRRGL